MAMFKLLISQFVEEIGSIEVEAESEEDALGQAQSMLLFDECDNWQDGDDALPVRVYGLTRPDGETTFL